MAKRKIIWSNKAQIQRFEILQFYINRNQNNLFSVKLNSKINKEIKLFTNFPYVGHKTSLIDIRGYYIDTFVVFYEITDKYIIIHKLFDTRQNPDSIIIK